MRVAIAGSNGKLPPGPGAPAAVQSLRYYRDPYGFLRACRAKYGDWFTVKQIPCGTIVYVADPDAVRELFADGGVHRVAPINAYMAPVLGDGLLLLDGEAHVRERRWLVSALQHAAAARDTIAREIDAELATWRAGDTFALRPRFEAVTLRVILRVLLGSSAERADRIAPLVLRLKQKDLVHNILAALPFGLATWRLSGAAARSMAAIDAELAAEVADRRAGRGPDDGMLAALAAHLGVSDRSIRDHVMTLIFTGHETVATTLAWTFERVLRTPAAHAALRAAVARDDAAYPEAVLLEAMRVRPTIADVGRELAAPFAVNGHALPAGTRLCPAIALVHTRPDLYPDPETFQPERFLDGARPKPWLYLPFGGGVRRCIGEAFAMLEMRTLLAAILARADLRADGPAERGISNGVTIAPHRGAQVTVEAMR